MDYNATLSKLSGLIDSYWEDYVEHKNLSFVVNPSIPVIWFGNLEAYCNSEVRVVTIGLNPSNLEFQNKNGSSKLSRFRYAKQLIEKGYNETLLIESYNKYFDNEEQDPYKGWFNSYEKVFDCLSDRLSVSYYGKKNNTAIHIDCQSALATKPTWSKLKKVFEAPMGADAKKLKQEYPTELKDITKFPTIIKDKLFEELLAHLKPHIMFFSQSEEEYLDPFINNGFLKDSKPYPTKFIREKQKKLKRIGYRVRSNQKQLLIFGEYYANQPFGIKTKSDGGEEMRRQREIFNDMIDDFNKW